MRANPSVSGPPVHAYPPLVTAVAVGIVLGADALVPGLSVFFPGQRVLGAVVAILGVVLVVWTTGRFRAARTTILPDRLDERREEMTTLLTDGPFAWSRNPIYLGMALLVTGAGLGVGSLVAPFVLAGFVWFIQTRQIVPEERVMLERFGERYADYAARTRRWFGRGALPKPEGGARA